MKRILSTLFLIGLFALTGCMKEEETCLYSKADIIGKWVVEEAKLDSKQDWANFKPLGDDYMWLQFSSNGVFTGKTDQSRATGVWFLSKSYITCSLASDEIVYYQIIEKSGAQLTLKMSGKGDSEAVWLRAVKR